MTTGMNVEDQQQVVGDFLQGLAQSFGIKADAENVSSCEDSFEVNRAGDDKELGLWIGPKGNHLVAIHEVSKTMVQRRLPGANRARIRVDVGGYRSRRREALSAYVQELAKGVASEGLEKGLEPMNAADRKVAHDTVNEIPDVGTISVGDEPRRRVVLVVSSDLDIS